jgi:hypothetical protein
MREPYELEFCPACEECIVDEKGEPQLCKCDRDKLRKLTAIRKPLSGRKK